MYIQDRQTQTFITDDGYIVTTEDGHIPWWYTRKAQLIKWIIFTSLFFLFLLYLFIGHYHAMRRLRAGKAPLRYHRWMLDRQQRAIHEPEFRDPVPQYGVYRPQYGVYRPAEYNMHTFPPPQYDPNHPAPPTYQPPQGATKIDPSQNHMEPTHRPALSGEQAPEYSTPPGPPPAVLANHAGSTNTYRL